MFWGSQNDSQCSLKKHISKLEVWFFVYPRRPPPLVWQKTTLFPDFFSGYLPLFTTSFICWNWQLVLLACWYYNAVTITWTNISLHLFTLTLITYCSLLITYTYLHLFTTSSICWDWQLVLQACWYYTAVTITRIYTY